MDTSCFLGGIRFQIATAHTIKSALPPIHWASPHTGKGRGRSFFFLSSSISFLEGCGGILDFCFSLMDKIEVTSSSEDKFIVFSSVGETVISSKTWEKGGQSLK